MVTPNTVEDKLEAIIDGSSLGSVLEALENVCRAKADHLAHNWQDIPASQLWNRAAGRIARVTNNHIKVL